MRPIRNPAKPPLRQRAPRLPGPGRALPGAARSRSRSRAIAGPPARCTRAPTLRAAARAGTPGAPGHTSVGAAHAHSAPPHPQVRSGQGWARPRAAEGARSRRLAGQLGCSLPGGERRARVRPCSAGARGRAWDSLQGGTTVWAAWVSMGRGTALVQDSARAQGIPAPPQSPPVPAAWPWG